jgi:hypothetical protein
VWAEKGIEHAGATIDLGVRKSVEPVAAITMGGEPVAGAMVFVNETPTLYEPAKGKTPALYAAGKVELAKDAEKRVARFRIVLPDADEDFTRMVPLPK